MSGREQCVLCIDNSEYMRNGDYSPNRFEAQLDACNMICGARTQSHPENTVAVLSMAGKSPAVNLSLTTDFSKMLATLASITISGSLSFAASIRIAKLALKRFSMEGTPNRRIISFVASPLAESKEELVKLGEELKKSNVAVDIVNFGEQAVNTEKLDAFIAAVNKENNSRLITIPPGPHLLSDMILKSPIIASEGRSGGPGVSGVDAFDFDPSMDPELAMAIRLSLEEENRRKQKESGTANTSTTQPSSSSAAPQTSSADAMTDEMYDEDEELRRAIELSKQLAEGDMTMEETDHDETTGLLSGREKLPSQQPPNPSGNQQDQNISDLLEDEDYLNSVISQLKKDDKKDENKDTKK